MTVVASLLAGVVFGLAMAAPPGPMNALIAEQSVLRGWPAGVRVGLGAMTGDVLFAALAFLGLVGVIQHAPTLRAVMVGAGGILMCYFAVEAARNATTAAGTGNGTTAEPGTDGAGGGFRKALALSLTNPYQIVFWLTVGVGLLRPGRLDVTDHAAWLGTLLSNVGLDDGLVIETGSAALLLGFFGGILVWVTGYPAAMAALGERSRRAGPVVAGVSAVVLAGFGLLFVADAALVLI